MLAGSFLQKVSKHSLLDQEAWTPDNAFSLGQIPFPESQGLMQESFNKANNCLLLWRPMHALHQSQDWSSLKSSLFTQFLVCASEGWALTLLGMAASYQWKHESPGKRWQAERVGTAPRRSLSVHDGEDSIGVVGG